MSKRTQSWIEFLFVYLQQKYDLENYNDKKEYAQEVANEIALLKDDFEKKNYYVRLQQISGFDMQLQNKVSVAKKMEKKVFRAPQIIKRPMNGKRTAQLQILSQMLYSKTACEYYRNELGFLVDEDCNSLALYIVDYYRDNDKIAIADLFDYIKEENVKRVLLEIANWELAFSEFHEEILKDAIIKVKQCIVNDKIDLLLKQSDQINDPIEKAKIAQEIISLQRERGGANNGKKD